MKRIILAAALSATLVACGGSPEGKFAKNCGASMEAEGMSAEQAGAACKCAYAKLEVELTNSQLKLAADVAAVNSPDELQEVAGDTEGAEFVMERVQGAIKSCAL